MSACEGKPGYPIDDHGALDRARVRSREVGLRVRGMARDPLVALGRLGEHGGHRGRQRRAEPPGEPPVHAGVQEAGTGEASTRAITSENLAVASPITLSAAP